MFLTKLNEVLTPEKSFIKERLNAAGFGLSLLINIIHWAVLYIKIQPGRASLLLHYNVLIGIDSVGVGLYIYYLPGLALLALIFNFILAFSFNRKEKLTAYFLSLASIPMQIFFLIASLALIIAND